MPKKDLLINIGKTFTFKTHSCLEKLRLVANADNLKVPQFPKAQVYRLPIQVPGFPSKNSIFPLKSFPPLQRRTTIPSSAINYGERKAHSHPHHTHPHPLNLPSSFHRLTVKEKPTIHPHHHPLSLAHLQLPQSVTALIDSIQTRVQTPDNDEGTGNPRETQTDSGNIAPVLLTSITR